MSCTGCEATFVIGDIDAVEGPTIYGSLRIPGGGGFGDEQKYEKLAEATGQEFWTSSYESTVNLSEPWVTPEIAQGGKAGNAALEAEQLPEDDDDLPGSDRFPGLQRGWRFTKNTPAAVDEGEPQEIYVHPLRYRVTLVDGVCSGTAASCTTGSSCRGLISIDLEITCSITSSEGISKFPLMRNPTSAGVHDPNAEAQNIQISYGTGFGSYRSTINPRGEVADGIPFYYNTTREMTVTFFIEPTGCGEAASWNSNLNDWLLFFDGYTMQSDDELHVEDGTFFMAIWCDQCQPIVPPAGGDENPGSQGGGKNFNQSSI